MSNREVESSHIKIKPIGLNGMNPEKDDDDLKSLLLLLHRMLHNYFISEGLNSYHNRYLAMTCHEHIDIALLISTRNGVLR